MTLVVDNASRAPAEVVAAQAGLATGAAEFLRLPENVGPAGGYAAGLKRFANSKHDVVWVMDDDSIPDSDCLARLLEQYSSESPGLIFPTVTDELGATTEYPAWSGVLIPRSIVEAVGVPKEEFFWWAEDSEYLQWRIPQAGFPVARVPQARLTHGRPRPRRRAAWKYYYEIRNHLYYNVHIRRGRDVKLLIVPPIRTVVRILLIENRRARKLWLFLRGCRDGLAGRLGKTLPVDSRDEPIHPTASKGRN